MGCSTGSVYITERDQGRPRREKSSGVPLRCKVWGQGWLTRGDRCSGVKRQQNSPGAVVGWDWAAGKRQEHVRHRTELPQPDARGKDLSGSDAIDAGPRPRRVGPVTSTPWKDDPLQRARHTKNMISHVKVTGSKAHKPDVCLELSAAHHGSNTEESSSRQHATADLSGLSRAHDKVCLAVIAEAAGPSHHRPAARTGRHPSSGGHAVRGSGPQTRRGRSHTHTGWSAILALGSPRETPIQQADHSPPPAMLQEGQ